MSISQDHPRLRGEHASERLSECNTLGSPPPTRGTQLSFSLLWSIFRITPAYAGNTKSGQVWKAPNRDHPRLRGEHEKVIDLKSTEWGSPPPTRGTLLLLPLLQVTNGITPAYAGNTFPYQISIARNKDHPRLRGEHSEWESDDNTATRITPAYAGNT